MKHRLYEHDAGLKLIKAIQLKIAIYINKPYHTGREIYNITRLYYIHQIVPIMHSYLLTVFVKMSETMHQSRKMEHQL